MTEDSFSAQSGNQHTTGSDESSQILRRQLVMGWIAVGCGTLSACIWAFWGSIENFHEGWYDPLLYKRMLGTLAYLGPMLLTITLTLLGIRFPRIGGGLYFAIAGWFTWWVISTRSDSGLGAILSWLPVTFVPVGAGLLFWLGRPRPQKMAYRITLLLPLAVALACSIEPIWRIAHRVDDGDLSARYVIGNEYTLVWAPAGPGWARTPHDVLDYSEAVERCDHLSPDGLSVMEESQNVWRLPTIEEAVASLTRAGHNAEGNWDADARRASYRVMPDKESPLWDPHSTTIYMWTSTEPDPEHAYKIVFNGQVWPVHKKRPMGSHGFRAVRTPTAAERAKAESAGQSR